VKNRQGVPQHAAAKWHHRRAAEPVPHPALAAAQEVAADGRTGRLGIFSDMI